MKQYIQNFNVFIDSSKIVHQEKGISWLSNYQGITDSSVNYKKYAVSPDYIKTRHLYANGIGDIPFEGNKLYSNSETEQPIIDKRSESAQEKVDEIFSTLYKNESEFPDHINHVSCTHYQSPSASQKTVIDKEWGNLTTSTHLYHMGCYAALPAIRVSKAYIADGSNKVDVVHTELCSYHLNKDIKTAEQMIMNTLFADGAIKYSVTSSNYFQNSKEDGLQILKQKEVLVEGTENEMSWKIGVNGFLMTLTRRVPLVIAKRIEEYTRNLFKDVDLDFDRDKDKVIFAIHPGGPKIIELIEKVLKLNSKQVIHSKSILKARGNMSSATIPHIWNEILQDQSIEDNTHIFTVAFGPGLTLTGAILKLCRK